MKQLIDFKKHLPKGVIVLLGVFLLSTGFDRYQTHPLQPITKELLPSFSLEESQIHVSAKAMTPEESKRSFGHDLISRGVVPVHLTIQNNTAQEYSMCASSVDLPSIKPGKVAFKITQSTIPRSIGYSIASFFFWPFMIPSTIDNIRVISHHEQLKKDFTAKSMRDEVVAPFSTFNRVLFVSEKEYKSSFDVTLIELESLKPTTFHTEVVG